MSNGEIAPSVSASSHKSENERKMAVSPLAAFFSRQTAQVLDGHDTKLSSHTSSPHNRSFLIVAWQPSAQVRRR